MFSKSQKTAITTSEGSRSNSDNEQGNQDDEDFEDQTHAAKKEPLLNGLNNVFDELSFKIENKVIASMVNIKKYLKKKQQTGADAIDDMDKLEDLLGGQTAQ